MKRTIAILLVAIMAAGSVFAALSGSAQIGVGANFDNGNYGFIDNSNSVGVNFELANMAGEAVGEGDIRASIKGFLSYLKSSLPMITRMQIASCLFRHRMQ